MFLTTTSDIIRVVTGSAVSTIGVHADWVDNAVGVYTPGRTNTAITTATTTTVVASPGASTTRNVKGLRIDNNHATSSCVVTVQHFDGTTSIDLVKVTLASGEMINMMEDGEWRHLTNFGAEYEYAGPSTPNLGITGAVAETMPRETCVEANAAALTSGTMLLNAIYLKAGTVVTNISFFSATTAAGTPTNQFFALYSIRLSLLARSTDATTAAWAANTLKTLAMASAYTVQVSGWYYVGIMVAATTVPTLKGLSASSSILAGFNVVLSGNSTTGLTTVLPDPCAALTANSLRIWAAIT